MTDPRLADISVFPDPIYKETVLRPLFDGAKNHHVAGFRAIDRAQFLSCHEQLTRLVLFSIDSLGSRSLGLPLDFVLGLKKTIKKTI